MGADNEPAFSPDRFAGCLWFCRAFRDADDCTAVAYAGFGHHPVAAPGLAGLQYLSVIAARRLSARRGFARRFHQGTTRARNAATIPVHIFSINLKCAHALHYDHDCDSRAIGGAPG
jgi:hypothetical protein